MSSRARLRGVKPEGTDPKDLRERAEPDAEAAPGRGRPPGASGPEAAASCRLFSDLGGLRFALDGSTLVSERIVVVDGREVFVGVQILEDPPPPWPPRAGEDSRAALSRLMSTIRVRLSVVG
jgi:hypothetical protein